MNKTLLVALALGCSMLASCSSHPSDQRASTKVSLDQVPPGTRDTDIYNLNGGEDTGHGAAHEGAGHEGAAHEEHGNPAEMNERKDVMLNHDEGKNDIGGNDQVPAEEKTTNSANTENHE